MLPQKRRLSRKHYILPNELRRYTPTPHLSMRVVSLSDKQDESRFAFVVSTKVSKSAVVRNKMRRQGYGVVKELLENVLIGKGVMFYYRKGSNVATYQEIKKEIISLLTQIGLLKNDTKSNN